MQPHNVYSPRVVAVCQQFARTTNIGFDPSKTVVRYMPSGEIVSRLSGEPE